MSILDRHRVTVCGPQDGQPMVFAHGFGCDQSMWRHVAPAFADRYRVITFDHIGAGGAPVTRAEADRHATLQGYAEDLLAIVRELDLHDAVLVGHSVSSMICALAAIEEPERFASLVMVAPSPRYIDDDDYVGGFSLGDVEELLESLESNYLGWSAAMAPVIAGDPEHPEVGQELTTSFCRMDPEVARRFARATFLSDNRADLPRISVPTLVLQCSADVIAPTSVGSYVAASVPDATLVQLTAVGHCPNLSAPAETTAAIEDFLRRRAA